MAKMTPITLAPLTQIPSVYLNEKQDEAINMPYRVPAGGHIDLVAGTASPRFRGGSVQSGSVSSVLEHTITLKPGTRLISVRAAVRDLAAQQITMELFPVVNGTEGAAIAMDVSDMTGNEQTLAIIGQTEDVPEIGVSVGTIWTVIFTFTAAGMRVHTIEVDTAVVP